MRRFILSVIAVLLIAFGIAGIVFSFVFMPKLSPVSISNETLNTLSVSITEGFDSMSIAMKNASIATSDIAESVNSAKDSLETASLVTEETSKAFKEMSKLVDFDILGLKPFESVYVYFQNGSESLSQLSKDLTNTGESLNINSGDIKALGSSLADISGKMNNLSVSFNKTTSSIPFDQFDKILGYLKIYIAILHAMFALIGFSILFLNTKQGV
ncbi:MAG TPA: hypothetical protein VIK09_06585 [Candidatus Humimicrobiaceae bacterium]|jgi:hypothetical protein|nr:hypothetical protein [Actinomycetota bacterium]